MFQTLTRRLTTFACAASLLAAMTVSPVSAQEFRVEGAGLEAVPTSYSGPCPGYIRFAGKIQASAAGRVKYTIFRNDGGTGPEGFVDVEGPGVKLMEYSWTLGGGSVTHYEGWVAIRILSPNNYESNHAKFVLDCEGGKDQQPNAQPSPGQSNKEAEAYQQLQPSLAAPQREKLDEEMASLKAFAEKFQPTVAEAQSKSAFDFSVSATEFKAIAEEPDAARRQQLSAAFQTKYEPQLIKLAQAASIDPAAQRRALIALLDFSNKPVKEGKVLGIEIQNEPRPSSTPTPTQPDVTERVLAAPYTSAGWTGSLNTANASEGRLGIIDSALLAESHQKVAFISQTLVVERGVRRVRVSATFDPAAYYITGASLPPTFGYSSAEVIVNLRLMEGSRVVASDHVSLGRVVTAVLGLHDAMGSRPITLQCEFTRSAPDDASTHTLIAEIEGWVGAGGSSHASISASGTLRQFQVYLHHR